VAFLRVDQGQAEHRAVGRDQRQVDAECLVERRRHLVDHRFGELDDGGDDQDEGQDAQVAQAERRQQPVFENPGDRRREHDDEARRQPHAQRAVDLPGHAHERAESEKTRHDDVVDQCGRDQQDEVFTHGGIRGLSPMPYHDPCHLPVEQSPKTCTVAKTRTGTGFFRHGLRSTPTVMQSSRDVAIPTHCGKHDSIGGAAAPVRLIGTFPAASSVQGRPP
jgi:hypothetical protein